MLAMLPIAVTPHVMLTFVRVQTVLQPLLLDLVVRDFHTDWEVIGNIEQLRTLPFIQYSELSLLALP